MAVMINAVIITAVTKAVPFFRTLLLLFFSQIVSNITQRWEK